MSFSSFMLGFLVGVIFAAIALNKFLKADKIGVDKKQKLASPSSSDDISHSPIKKRNADEEKLA